MNTPPPHTSDTIKAEDWTGDMGARWLSNLGGLEDLVAPIGRALLAQADYRPGEHVLDIGSGGGTTTIAIARSVAPDGMALGVDIAPDLVGVASRRAAEGEIGNARFLCADAATVHLPDAPYDRLFSRFGSMFFDDPVAAFTNLHSLLRAGGRIDLAVWGPPRDNPWMMETINVARNHVDLPPRVPRAPGPFAFEDLDYLEEILTDAGFSGLEISERVEILPLGGPGSSPEQAVRFALAALAFGPALAEQGEEVRAAAAREMRSLFEKHHDPANGVTMPGKAWLVSASAATR